MRQLELGASAYHRILEAARTIVDLDHRADIALHHLLEAIHYRSLDPSIFGPLCRALAELEETVTPRQGLEPETYKKPGRFT